MQVVMVIIVCFVGMYADDDCPDDSKLFICERHAFADLLDGLKTPCSCGMSSHPWVLDSVVQVCYLFTHAFDALILSVCRVTI